MSMYWPIALAVVADVAFPSVAPHVSASLVAAGPLRAVASDEALAKHGLTSH